MLSQCYSFVCEKSGPYCPTEMASNSTTVSSVAARAALAFRDSEGLCVKVESFEKWLKRLASL
jgi:hypothetical protein